MHSLLSEIQTSLTWVRVLRHEVGETRWHKVADHKLMTEWTLWTKEFLKAKEAIDRLVEIQRHSNQIIMEGQWAGAIRLLSNRSHSSRTEWTETSGTRMIVREGEATSRTMLSSLGRDIEVAKSIAFTEMEISKVRLLQFTRMERKLRALAQWATQARLEPAPKLLPESIIKTSWIL